MMLCLSKDFSGAEGWRAGPAQRDGPSGEPELELDARSTAADTALNGSENLSREHCPASFLQVNAALPGNPEPTCFEHSRSDVDPCQEG